VLPSKVLLQAFNDLVEPMFLRREELEREAFILACIRDSLLPKLISGELSVREVERANAQARA
jgi:type I restriction enzyme S subunit